MASSAPAQQSAASHWLASLPKLMLKRLPMMLASAAFTWVIHTYLMAVVNEGTGGGGGFVGSLLNTTGGALLTTPAAMFVWAMLSAYAWNYIFLLRKHGPVGAFNVLAQPILATFRNVPGLAQQERGAWCFGAGAAVVAAQLLPITPGANVGLGVVWANIGLSQPGQWVMTRVTGMMPGLLTQAGAGIIAVSATMAQTLVMAFAPGLIASSLIPGQLGWLVAAVLLVMGYMWLTGRGQAAPGAGVKSLLFVVGGAGLVYGVLNAMDLLLPLHLLADDGGWAESMCPVGDLSCWVKSQGAVPVLTAGVAPAIGGAFGPLIPLVGDPGTGAPPTGEEEPPSPEKVKEWIDRWNGIHPDLLLGNPKLQEEYRDIMDRYKATGKIDEQALADFERKVGQATDESRKNREKEDQAGLDRSRALGNDRDAALEADAQRRRDLEKQLQDTLGRVANGDLNSAAGLGIANNPDVYNADGSINKAKLDAFTDSLTKAKRDLANQQRDDAQAVANTSGRVSDAWTAAEWAAKQARDRSANVVGAIATGGIGAAAGGGLIGAVAAGTAGTYIGAAQGAIKAASEAGSLDRDVLLGGAAEGARGGAIGGVLGGAIGGIAGGLPTNAVTTAIASNPTVAGVVMGGVGAVATGGNVIEGMVDGGLGGKFGGAAGRTMGKPGGGWKKPIDWETGPLGGTAPPTDVTEGDPWAGKATPPPKVGPGSNKGPQVGLSEPAEPWMKPVERGGGPKPEPTKIKGQDIDAPPDAQQPWKKRWGTDPETGKQTDAGIPPEVDPDGEPYFPKKVRGENLPKDYEGPGATPGKKYPGGTGKDDGTIEPYTTQDQKAAAAAAREAEVARLAQLDKKELAKQLTDAEMLAQDKKQADLIRDAIKRQNGDTKPPVAPEPPPDPAIRQAELDKLKSRSRKELETEELIAQIEGDKKKADLMREALDRNKEPQQPPKMPSRDARVKDLSNLDLEDLQASRDAARASSDEATALSDAAKARGDAAAASREAARARNLKAQEQLYDDAMDKQLKDITAQAKANRPPEDLSKRPLDELKQRERDLRAAGDQAGADEMAAAAKKKSSYGAEEDARLEAVMEQRRQANAAARAAKEAEANMTPAQREQQAAAAAELEQAKRAADGLKRKAELDQLMEQMKAAQGKGPAAPPPPVVDEGAVTNPNLSRPGTARPPAPPTEADFDAKTNPNLSRPGTPRPEAPPPAEADFNAETNPNLSRPGTQRPTAEAPPTPPASGGDYDGLSATQLKSMQEMARASGDNTQADEIGKQLEKLGVPPPPPPRPLPDRPEVRMPWEEPGAGQSAGDATPNAPPPRADVPEAPPPVKADDLPEPGRPLNWEQRQNLNKNYSEDQLLAARNQARVEGRSGDASALDDVLAERGYRAPVDPKDVTAPPPGELPDYSQVQTLSKKYSFDQLRELGDSAAARGDTKMADIIGNAINDKKTSDPMGAAEWIARQARGGR